MASDNQINLTMDAVPPFTFGIGLQGELVIGYHLRQSGDLVKCHLVIPAEEVKVLLRGLQENTLTQETLAAKPPTQSRH